MSKELVCANCGCMIGENENYHETEDGIVCDDCFDEYYYACEECGDCHHIDNLVYLEHYNHFVCEDCLYRFYEQCTDCGQYFYRDDMYLITNLHGEDYYVCEQCRWNGWYATCEDCGRIFQDEDMTWNEHNDCYYCYDCNENHVSDFLLEYHEFDDWETYAVNSEDESILKGFELEVEGDNSDKYLSELHDILGDFVVFEEDGSLDDGFEMISNPFTRQYMEANKYKMEQALDFLKNDCIFKNGTGNAGFHIHVNRKMLETDELSSDDVIDNIIIIMETFKAELMKFSRRTESDLRHWASFLSDKDSGLTLSYKDVKAKKQSAGRYVALNLTNSQTIEFRIFKGTLDFHTFMAALELVDNIVDIARSNKIEGLTWDDIVKFNGDYIADYVNDYNIESDVVLHIVEEDGEDEEVHNFKVGDIVVANELSNFYYSLTNLRNGFVGRVIGFKNGRSIVVEDLYRPDGFGYTVSPMCFDLKED